uniref:Uncharacterized protein n=1 Tax=Heterosigma akashiwo TaxID=2829 RepID=A0A7S3Y597_HETAK
MIYRPHSAIYMQVTGGLGLAAVVGVVSIGSALAWVSKSGENRALRARLAAAAGQEERRHRDLARLLAHRRRPRDDRYLVDTKYRMLIRELSLGFDEIFGNSEAIPDLLFCEVSDDQEDDPDAAAAAAAAALYSGRAASSQGGTSSRGRQLEDEGPSSVCSGGGALSPVAAGAGATGRLGQAVALVKQRVTKSMNADDFLLLLEDIVAETPGFNYFRERHLLWGELGEDDSSERAYFLCGLEAAVRGLCQECGVVYPELAEEGLLLLDPDEDEEES